MTTRMRFCIILYLNLLKFHLWKKNMMLMSVNANGTEYVAEHEQVVPVAQESPRSVLVEDLFADALVPDEMEPGYGVPDQAPAELVYYRVLRTIMTAYSCNSSQFTLPARVGRYLRANAPGPWMLRGPSGITIRVNILIRAGVRHIKFGKGWRRFCKTHDLEPGEQVTLSFSDGVTRLIDVEIHR